MKSRTIGQAGLQGWRTKVADAIAKPVARRTSTVSEADVRTAIGALFLLLTLTYLIQAFKEVVANRD